MSSVLTLPQVRPKQRKGMVKDVGIMSEPKLTIEQIETLLGFDKVQPVIATPSDSRQIEDNKEYFREWYEEELRELLTRSDKDDSRS